MAAKKVERSYVLEKLLPDNLLHIYQYLSPLDVACASEASEYLSHFAEDYIYKKAEDCFICFQSFVMITMSWSWHGYRLYKAYDDGWSDIEIILRHFGPHIKRLNLKQLHFKIQLSRVAYILDKCTHLDELRLRLRSFECINDIDIFSYGGSVEHLILDNINTLNYSQFPKLKLFAKVTALTIDLRCSSKVDLDITKVVNSVSTLKRLTLNEVKIINLDLFNALQKHRDSLCSLALTNIYRVGSRYNDIAVKLPKLEQLRIDINSQEDLDALTELNIKYLQLLSESLDPCWQPKILRLMRLGKPTNGDKAPLWSLNGLPLLEELDLVALKNQLVLNVPLLHKLSLKYSSNIDETIATLPNLKRLRLHNFQFESMVLDRLFEITCKKTTEVELDNPEPKEITQLLKYLDERRCLKNAPSPLVRILCSRSQVSSILFSNRWSFEVTRFIVSD